MSKTYATPAGFTEQDTIRLGKLNALIEQGRNPYEITTFPVTHHAKEIIDGADALMDQLFPDHIMELIYPKETVHAPVKGLGDMF